MNTDIIIQVATVCGAFMGIIALVTWIKATLTKSLKPLQVQGQAIRSILKNSITRVHRESVVEGKIGRYTLESVLEMYTQYKELGGNGFVDKIVDEINELDIDAGIERDKK